MSETKNLRFCVVGNIIAQHIDADGKLLYGSKAFSSGTKVYIDDLTYNLNQGRVSVIGQNRFGRYVVESVPNDLIENVRAQRVLNLLYCRLWIIWNLWMGGPGVVEPQKIKRKSMHL